MRWDFLRTSFLALGMLLLSACTSGSPATGGSQEVTSTSATPSAPVQHGTVRHWPETTAHLVMNIDSDPPSATLGLPPPTGLIAFWSVATTSGEGSGFFYADTFRSAPETRIAHVTSVAHVGDIHDASAFEYTQDAVGPVSKGQIVLVHHLPSARFLALVVDAIEPTDPHDAGAGPYAYADVSWYLSSAGSADFSGAR